MKKPKNPAAKYITLMTRKIEPFNNPITQIVGDRICCYTRGVKLRGGMWRMRVGLTKKFKYIDSSLYEECTPSMAERLSA